MIDRSLPTLLEKQAGNVLLNLICGRGRVKSEYARRMAEKKILVFLQDTYRAVGYAQASFYPSDGRPPVPLKMDDFE